MEAIFWIVILTNGDICRSQKSPSLYSSVFPTFFFLSVKSDPYPGILAVYLMDVCSDIETCHAQIRYTLTLACRVRVASWFGVPGTVLNRFRSYLSCCCFRIKYNNNIFLATYLCGISNAHYSLSCTQLFSVLHFISFFYSEPPLLLL